VTFTPESEVLCAEIVPPVTRTPTPLVPDVAVIESFPDEVSTAVEFKPDTELFANPTEAEYVAEIPSAALAFMTRASAALADDTDTRESTPAPSATTVASAMRFEIVFVDICFLSMGRSRIS
jgi:hypothetical protein